MVRRLPERRALPAAGFLIPSREGPLLGLGPDGVAARDGEPCSRRNEAAVSHPELQAQAPAGAAGALPVSPSVVQPLSPGRGTRCSSRPALSSTGSWSASEPCWARGRQTASWPQSSSRRSPRSCERLEARRFDGRRLPAKAFRRRRRTRSQTHRPPRGTSPRPPACRRASATGDGAATWTSKVDGVRKREPVEFIICPVRPWRRPQRGEHPADVPHPQHLPRRVRLREKGNGPSSASATSVPRRSESSDQSKDRPDPSHSRKAAGQESDAIPAKATRSKHRWFTTPA